MALPLLRRFLIEAGKDKEELIGDVSFDMTNVIEKWLTNRAHLFAKEITSTTYDKLKSEFAESFANGESRQQLIKRVESVYDGFDTNRAKMIARTEVHGAVQKGSFETNRQAGIDLKIWVSVLDDRTRDSHAYLDGEERKLDQKFSNGLLFSGDPNGPAEETINCRCSTV
jgi:SPP1 gp7 family putative phage head morphogenesis protein